MKVKTANILNKRARFDYEKARWVNHQKITQANTDDLIQMDTVKKMLSDFPKKNHLSLFNLVKERLFSLNDLRGELSFIQSPYAYDEKVLEKLN